MSVVLFRRLGALLSLAVLLQTLAPAAEPARAVDSTLSLSGAGAGQVRQIAQPTPIATATIGPAADTPTPTPTVTPTPSPPATPTPPPSPAPSRPKPPYIGVWSDTYDPSLLDDLGGDWGRVTALWSDLEPDENAYRWGTLDALVVAASGGGRRQVLVTISQNPAWAATSPCTLTTDAERARLAELAAALATRYRGLIPDGPHAGRPAGVKYWAFYNEPDHTSEASSIGGCFGTLVGRQTTQAGRDRYARMIEAVGSAVHAADPGASVIMGALASGNFTDLCADAFYCTVDRDFLRGVVAALRARGSAGQLDGVAVNYYSSQSGEFEGFGGVDLIGRVEEMRQQMLAAGLTRDQVKPILVQEGSYTGEFGYMPGTSTSDPAHPYNQAQRNYVPKALARAAYLDVVAYFWFWLRDASGGLGSDAAYGLIDLRGGRKPSYYAVRHFARLVDRSDRLVGRLTFASPKLEGYEFATLDNRRVQIVWNQVDDERIPYLVPAPLTVSGVTGPTGDPVVVCGNLVSVGAEPRFIFYTRDGPPPICTPTPTPTGTPTPPAPRTATSTQSAASTRCSPRPRVEVAVRPGGPDRLDVTITAGSSAGAAGNHLRELRIGDAANALIDVAGRTGQTGNVTIALADRPTQLTMTVRRLRTGQGVMVPLVVVDDCGEWPTFVGSGGSGPPDRPGSTSR